MGNCIGKKPPKGHRYSSCKNPLGTRPILPSLLSEETTSIRVSHQVDIRITNEEKVGQCSSSLITNEQVVFIPSSPILSPDQIQFQSNNTESDLSETHLISITNEEETSMGYFFSKEKEQEIPIDTQEIISESFDTSLSDSSFSSFSGNSTSFTSEDQLILSSSSSSSININPILSSYSNQIHLPQQSSQNEIFSTTFPVSSSRYKNNSFLNQFHHHTISHHYKTLSSVIDDVIQQQSIRIHRQTKCILIEHQQLQCIPIKDVNSFDTPSLIFDENQKLVYITKYAPWNDLQSITCNTKDTSRRSSSCDDCSLLLSGWKLNQHLHSFLIVNTTYHLIQRCFNEIHQNHFFGYISQIQPNRIRQTVIDNSKLNYSYDLEVNYTDVYFVLRVQSWPKEIQLIYEQRPRLWPVHIEHLFDNTCFIQYRGNEEETPTDEQCPNCEKMLSSVSNASWSYTYAAIEAALVLSMSEGHLRFASIAWNYFNGKTQGQLPFRIFKHTLFYFFEQYSSDSFTTSDLLSHLSLFIDFLLNRFQTKSLPHYFNSNANLYDENISINLISIKMTYLDLRNCSIYLLPNSSLYLYHLIYLIQFQSMFFQSFPSLKTTLPQTILDTHEVLIHQLSSGVKTYQRQLDSTLAIKSHQPLTLDCLYRYQEENVQIILDYLPLLRAKEPSLLIHLLWSIFVQYFNSLFADLFIS